MKLALNIHTHVCMYVYMYILSCMYMVVLHPSLALCEQFSESSLNLILANRGRGWGGGSLEDLLINIT